MQRTLYYDFKMLYFEFEAIISSLFPRSMSQKILFSDLFVSQFNYYGGQHVSFSFYLNPLHQNNIFLAPVAIRQHICQLIEVYLSTGKTVQFNQSNVLFDIKSSSPLANTSVHSRPVLGFESQGKFLYVSVDYVINFLF